MAFHFDERKLICRFAEDNPDVAELQFIRDDNEGFKTTFYTGGTVNYIFQVESSDGSQSIIVKYGEEFMRCDPSEYMPLDRQQLEYDCLLLSNSILPGSAPKPYCLDRKSNILAMEDLSHMALLGDELKKGRINMDLARNIGKTLAIVHRSTTESEVSPEIWQEWLQKFGNSEALEHYASWAIERIFIETDRTVACTPKTLISYRKCVKLLEPTGFIKKAYTLFKTRTCFIHADSYWEAMFVKDSEVKVFDFEFAFLSRPAMQLGWVLASYMPCMLQAINNSGMVKTDLIRKNKEAVHTAVQAYMEEVEAMLRNKNGKEEFIGELALFAGHGEFLFANWAVIGQMVTNTDEDKIWLTESGTRLMLNHENISTAEQLVDIMFAEL